MNGNAGRMPTKTHEAQSAACEFDAKKSRDVAAPKNSPKTRKSPAVSGKQQIQQIH
jgi:hypothetical protein